MYQLDDIRSNFKCEVNFVGLLNAAFKPLKKLKVKKK